MHQFVESAIEAAKQGDNNKALAFLKQVLNANPNDIDAWLVLAAVVDDPQRKRQCLKRVLTLDPANQVAREELLEMDRAEMSGTSPAVPEPVSAPTTIHQPEPSPAFSSMSTSAFEAEPETQPLPPPVVLKPKPAAPDKTGTKKITEKKLVFKYPLILRILMYFFVVVFGCSGLLIATQSIGTGLFFLGLGVVMLVTALAFSPSVEISDAGIRASAFLSSRETGWDEITRMKSNAMKRRLELTKRNGETVNVSTQVSRYPQIVEIIRRRRPDLFGITPSSSTSAFGADASPSAGGNASPVPSFTGTKVFKKGWFAQYGVILLMIPIFMVGGWLALTSENKFAGIGVALVGLFFMAMSLFNINHVKLEPNKLTTETFFGEKEYTAREIKEIGMKTVRSRHGIASNFVNIQLVKGGSISMAGFPDGDEIIYGILINWWESYRNR